MDFIKYDSSLLTKGNCIAFICDGEGSIGYSIYKYEDFIGSTTIKVGRNKMLNKFNAMFITTVADKVRSKYNFGFKRNLEHLSAEKLLLPIDEKGELNWKYMENYVKQKLHSQAKQIISYYES